MIFFYWDKYFVTGFEEMDKQHQEFIILIDKLQNSVYAQDLESFKKYSAEYIGHLEDHFNFENELMKSENYPGYFSHKAEHDRFFDKMKKGIFELNNRSTNELNAFFEVAYRWFKNHLEINDRKLAKFIKDKNKN